ncbi:MAG: hypothetical protein EHM58_00400 [Ignavibacteriae bacterium]|nr:MAG: hypothetical protein EHM58_00400 [Ignavibacteriota bacterium]
MSQTILTSVLDTFTKDEIRDFNNFISSPYFNKNPKICFLFSLISKKYPNCSDFDIYCRKTYQKVYKSKNYNDSTLRSLVHRTTKLLEEFLIIENLGNREIDKLDILLNDLNRRNLKNAYNKVITENINKLKGKSNINYNFFYSMFKIEVNNYNNLKINDKIIKKNNIKKHLNSLNNANVYLTMYYIMDTINNYIRYMLNCKKYNINFCTSKIAKLVESLNIKEIYEIIKETKFDYIVELYINLLDTYVNIYKETNKYYMIYKNNVELYAKQLSKDEIRFHYSNLINYCNIKENQCPADDTHKLELLFLYEVMLKKRLYIYDRTKYLPVSLFRAILFHSLRIGKSSWTYEFISNYVKEIDPKQRVNMYNFGMAFYYNTEMEFEKALDCLNRIEQNYFIFKYDAKCLKATLYYSLGYIENLIDHLHTYKEFLRNDELLSEDLKKYHKSFIFYLGKLILLNSDNSKDDFGYMFNKLQKTEIILQKEWLIKKFTEKMKYKTVAI